MGEARITWVETKEAVPTEGHTEPLKSAAALAVADRRLDRIDPSAAGTGQSARSRFAARSPDRRPIACTM